MTIHPTRIVTVLTLLVIVSVPVTSWPLRLQYAIARPALNSLATQVKAGHKVDRPVRIGLLSIKRAEINRGGVICLWTVPDTAGSTGFVKTTQDKVKAQFSVWSSLRLSKDWQFIQED